MIEQNQQQAETIARAALDAEEEQKKRRASQSVDMGNPGHAQLGANIRPDVGSGPAGLETHTTQKSAVFRAIDAVIGLFSGRQTEEQVMTLEAIAADPWNAVELPLPPNADQKLLLAARGAADQFVHSEHHLMMEAREGRNEANWSAKASAAGIPQPDAHEYNEGRWLQALDRFELVTAELAERQRMTDALEYGNADEQARRERLAGEIAGHFHAAERAGPSEAGFVAWVDATVTQRELNPELFDAERPGLFDAKRAAAAEQQQGDGMTPPEVTSQAPKSAKEQYEAELRDFMDTDRQERRKERQHGEERETTQERGRGIDRDRGGGIS